MMHGHEKMGATPTFDVVMLLPACWCRVHFFSVSWYTPIRVDLGWISPYWLKPVKHADLARTGPELADSSRNSKKKKKNKVQNALFELNNKTLNYLSS